ncbi:hypothetical protein C7448_10462 [Tenacibaculum gallaicum]|uniref:Lipoprotein n=2 Tax=Tenacibaculum gallaicum TaxID=561505 RepID=A0A3E0HW08_9FLAO|nr:hypothetical protein C7448_10462 [Tenacibaculum gallaicum]
MKMRRIIYICILLFIVSCSKHKYYLSPFIQGNIYDVKSKKPIDSVKLSINLLEKSTLKVVSQRETLSSKDGFFSLNSDHILYTGDGREESSLFDGRYTSFLILEKRGCKKDTIQIEKHWKRNDTIAKLDSIFLKPLDK